MAVDIAELYELVLDLVWRVEQAYSRRDFAIDSTLAAEYADYLYAAKLLTNDAFVRILQEKPPQEVVSPLFSLNDNSVVMQWLWTSTKRLAVRLRQLTAQAIEEKDEEQKSGSKEAYIEPRRQLEAYQKIREIIEAAKQEIVIIDNYVNRDVVTLLTNAKAEVEIRLLTKTAPPDFGLEVRKFYQQRANLQVRTGLVDFHDRFIIADDKCWHLGASIKDAGGKAFALNLFEDRVNMESVRRNIEDAWQNGTPLT